MKIHSNNFKENIARHGKDLDSKIIYELNGETIELGTEQLNSITPRYNADILKSVMKILEIDSNIDIPIGTIVNYQFGVKVGNNYEYLDFGNYVVYSSEKQEDLRSYKIVCYDKMLYSMVDYVDMNITYPITVRSYINTICTHLGLTFANASNTFANYDKEIPSELYLDENKRSLGYKFRDVLDELAQVTASTICINENDELEIRYITETSDVIDEDYFKDINVDFGEKYGPINSIVLSRSNAEDNVYLRDEDSVLLNGLCEIKINDNQIMNDNNRADYLPDILNQLDGLEYYINDYASPGIMYYDLCDKYTARIGNKDYSCVMFNDEALVTQGLQENIHTDMPEITETDYSKADKTDRRINQAYIIVNKQEGRIDEVVSQLNDTNGAVEEVKTTQTAQERKIEIISSNIDENGNVTGVTTTTGFTFNASGMHISGEGFDAQHTSQGTYYRDGNSIVGQYTKDGSKQKDLELFGVYSYGKNNINDTPMFVAQLYTDENGEEGFGHFYNGGDL